MKPREWLAAVRSHWKWAIAALAAALAVWGIAAARRMSASRQPQQLTFEAAKGPLTISITEDGDIQAKDQTIIKSQVQGSTTILSLVPEGTLAKQGDLLLELDATKLADQKFEQQIKVKNAEASYIRSREDLAVTRNQALSDQDKAALDAQFSEQDLTKYKEGEYPQNLRQAQAKIKIAEEDQQRAQEKLKWSKVLFADNYISQTELQADELAAKKAALDLELATGDLRLLEDYTHARRLEELESAVRQTALAKERTERKCKASILQGETELSAREMEYQRQQERLTEIEQQIAKTRIVAPTDGLVVYATSVRGNRWHGADTPLAEGQEVRERQELIYLPQTSRMQAALKVHESKMKQIRIGMKATIIVDALPGRRFAGQVEKIAPLPDPVSVWMNPDLKVYDTVVQIEGDGSELRNGMTCKVELLVEEHADVVYVPVQCVVREGGQTCVYVARGRKPVRREVDIGMDNNLMVHIVSGLTPGEPVLLSPPLGESRRSGPPGDGRPGKGRAGGGGPRRNGQDRSGGGNGGAR